MQQTKESEDLAQRLRSLYQTYSCEQELPPPEDLVAKLDQVNSEVRRGFQIELGKGQVYPLSLEEAMQYHSFREKVVRCFGIIYVCGPSTVPAAIKEVFLKPKREWAKEFLRSYNYRAKKIFEEFKEEVEYELNNPED